jgi:hypothetical protein
MWETLCRRYSLTLKLFPISLAEANLLVEEKHRHNGPLRSGAFFSIGLLDTSLPANPADKLKGPNGEKVIGTATVGPVAARGLTTPYACEVRRLTTIGTKNACSILYGACWRAAQALGFRTAITYTLTTEAGASLRAANFRLDDDHVPVRHWKSRSPEFAHLRWKDRPNTANSPALPRYRWFIGERLPSNSKIRYPDDPPTMGSNPNLDPWNENRGEEGNQCGRGVTSAHLASNEEDPVKLGVAALAYCSCPDALKPVVKDPCNECDGERELEQPGSTCRDCDRRGVRQQALGRATPAHTEVQGASL